MCLGFPGRTTKDTMESVTMPFVAFVSQLLDTRPALTTLPMSGSSEKLTTSAGSPSTTEVAWVPEGPKEGEMVTPAPALVLAKSVASTREGGLGRRVRHQVDGAALGAGGQGTEGQAGQGHGPDGADAAS